MTVPGKEAILYRPLEGSDRVVCTACARYCKVGPGQIGLCGIRGNVEGKLYLFVYGKVIAGHIDPIEKKPVTHYRPGSKIFSIATTGCNWLCQYCLTPGTLVLTREGPKPIEGLFAGGRPTERPEVRLLTGETVLTHRGRWRRALKAFQHLYCGPIVRIASPLLEPLRCTPNHRVFVPAGNGPLRKVPAGALRAGDLLAVPLPRGPPSPAADLRPFAEHGGSSAREAPESHGASLLILRGHPSRPHPPSLRPLSTGTHLLVPIERVEGEEYVGPVYNLEVEEDHSYTANFAAVANCQNYDISQRRKVEGLDATPEQVVAMALRYRSDGIAYTYNQPTIFIEYAHDIGVIARQRGLINIFVSNGYDTPDTVQMMKDFLDCITVDFKGSGEEKFVRKYIGIPNAQPIYDTLRELHDKTDIHVEITDLVVPQVGDNLEEARKLCRFVYDLFGPDIPIHFLRWHPDYKMLDLPLTPVETLERHCAVAREVGLRYVYIGNVPGHPLEHTYCPGCGQIAIRRFGFDITGWNLDRDNRCRACGYQLPIVGGLAESVREDRFRPVIW